MSIKHNLNIIIVVSALCIASKSVAGSWELVPSPPLAPSTFLFSVTAPGNDNVWAVGETPGDLGSESLIEHWNGTSWRIVADPNRPRSLNGLLGVAAFRQPQDILAVGYGRYLTNAKILIEQLEGRRWRVVPSPNIEGSSNYLYSVKGLSSNDVWAVGYSGDSSGGLHSLAMHFDGISWTIVPTPMVQQDQLRSVDAIASNDVWAVGVTYPNLFESHPSTLILHWDGASWSVVPSPNVGDSSLRGVAAVSAGDIWAVGFSGLSGFNAQTLTLHWDGNSWAIVPSAQESSDEVLNSVTVLAPDNVWAVGGTGDGFVTRSQNWNGTAWVPVEVPPPGGMLLSVTASPNGTLWAVGTGNVIYRNSP